jgi:hypothetical protein
VGVSASSLIVMPLLGIAKKRIGAQLGSAAVRSEGRPEPDGQTYKKVASQIREKTQRSAGQRLSDGQAS